ncbi:MAG: peptide ABC transporter substrate-binding protein, partial [Opitutaceae bacterium]|nr:peptide ABC transporter substrate-binding protein [Opitutaceae bacterium]
MLNRCIVPLLAAFVVLAGCKKQDGSPSPSKAQAQGAGSQVLHFGNGTEPQDLDPQVVTGVPENKIINALFEGLVAYGPNGQGTTPAAAARWTISPDGLVYTFYLQPEGRWSNGDPVTATDFVRSYQRLLTPSLAAEYANKLYPVVGAEEFNLGK